MNSLLRAGGIAAVIGGVLRIADSFTTEILSAATLAMLYFATDVFLLAGIAALWWKRRDTLGIAGTIGIAVFVAGILLVRASAFGVVGYQLGATVALLGLVIYALETLFKHNAAPWAPVAWLIAFAFGVAGTLGVAPEAMTMAAGVAFGLGFVAAGGEMLTG